MIGCKSISHQNFSPAFSKHGSRRVLSCALAPYTEAAEGRAIVL